MYVCIGASCVHVSVCVCVSVCDGSVQLAIVSVSHHRYYTQRERETHTLRVQ